VLVPATVIWVTKFVLDCVRAGDCVRYGRVIKVIMVIMLSEIIIAISDILVLLEEDN
jgi:hypothetical protein